MTLQNATYLGVDVLKDLEWHKDSERVKLKGNRTLGFIICIIKTASRKTKVKAYKALVHPTMEYASTVLNPHQVTLSDPIEMVPRRGACYVMNRYSTSDSVPDMLRELSWDVL